MFYTIQEIWILRDNSDKFRFEIVFTFNSIVKVLVDGSFDSANGGSWAYSAPWLYQLDE
jgi:hypothetical protein